MICQLSKWCVSNSSDKHKPLPGFVQNHLNRCRSCQEFEKLVRDLELDAASDAQSVIRKATYSFTAKMNLQPAASAGRSGRDRKKPKLLPLLSASAALTAVVLLFVLFLSPSKKTPSPPPIETFSFLFSRDSLPGGNLQKLAAQASTPFDEEWLRLRKAVQTASRYLTSRLDLKIDPPLNQ